MGDPARWNTAVNGADRSAALDGGPELLRRFATVVATAGDRTAVVAPDGAVSFAQLADRVTAVAAALRARQIGRGSLVGVCLPRRVDLVATLLAVWRVDAAILPLDTSYPAERLRLVAQDAGVDLVVVAGSAARWLDGYAVVTVDQIEDTGVEPARTPVGSASAHDPAYVIYTSGSTGRPKGVQVSHGSVAHLVSALEQAGLYAEAPRVVAWNASVSFDASVQQWARVCRGDTIVLIDAELRADPARLGRFLRQHGVTDLDVTPSHWDALREHLVPQLAGGPPLRLFVGGEAVPDAMWAGLAEAARRGVLEPINVYGPTECTVDATFAWIGGDGGSHIGRPLPGVRAYVLDDRLRPVPEGADGELYLAGPGVALGYLNQPALTAQRFVPEPGGPDGGRMYRTGDRVRRRPDGTLAYLGRRDRQVKIRGHRIELGEIEAVVGDHPGVSAAVAVLRQDQVSGPRLVAYYRPVDGADPAASALRDHAAARLPEAMVPAAFVALAQFPLTASGKIDMSALPDPAAGAELETDADGASATPLTAVEGVIAEAWAEVLGRETVVATDDFFALGGHSLLALRLAAQVKRRFGVTMSTRAVYRHPQLRDLARHIEHLRDRPAG